MVQQSILWGLLPGTLTAVGGAYKDCLYEPFEAIKFVRSPLVCLFWYIIVDRQYPSQPVFLKIGLASMLERLSVETYKALIGKMPGKFTNCTCENSQCVVQKDRGWMLRRLNDMVQ